MEVDLPHSHLFDNSGDWIPITHPGGALYFYHERMRIFTDVYMYDPILRREVEKSAEMLETKRSTLEKSGIPFPTTNYDLVLDIVETEDKVAIRQYYYVDHNNRTLFWLDDYEMKPLMDGILGVKEPGHIKRRLESLYWVHWSQYPTGYKERNFPNDASDELQGVLLSSSIDSLTCNVSTAPYSVADMQTMCDIINKVKNLGPENSHAICSVARLLSICVYWRFVHFHGQKTSRQNRYKSIYHDSGHKRTIPFRLVSVILFFSPDAHLRELKKVWADESIFEGVWRDFMQKLVSEWTDFVLYSTVMLTANVTFLAVQGVIVIPSDGGWIKASPAQIASTISLVYSIGSIITGLLLIRRHRAMVAQDARTAYGYLNKMTKPFFYLEPLAAIFSFTYALLMCDNGYSGLRGSCLWDCRHPHNLVHRKFLGLRYC
ncbi:hypothetical protein DFH94DRAFT_53546 [Russula ochroleuca]|uniref:Uncharacterized protein n=1 Tax=Russula ochroleuca TaxID=152965 RepID=A0A9P5MTR1_9AGAM|nr:hypothetical protein DFH94DRAFT_53546 [Russula ochroleuca]